MCVYSSEPPPCHSLQLQSQGTCVYIIHLYYMCTCTWLHAYVHVPVHTCMYAYMYEYYFAQAVCAVGHSDWSSSLTFSTSPSPPSPPSHLTLVSPPVHHTPLGVAGHAAQSGVTAHTPLQVTSSPSHLHIVWTVPSSRGSPLTSYHVQLTNQNTTRLLSVLATETQATLDSLQPDTAYQ